MLQLGVQINFPKQKKDLFHFLCLILPITCFPTRLVDPKTNMVDYTLDAVDVP